MSAAFFFFLLTFFLPFLVDAFDFLIVEPANAHRTDLPAQVLVFTPGAFLAPQQYLPLLTQVRDHTALSSHTRFFIAFTKQHRLTGAAISNNQFAQEMFDLIPRVDRVLQGHGGGASASTAQWFYAGHSRGAILVQDFVKSVLDAKQASSAAAVFKVQNGGKQSGSIGSLADVPLHGMVLLASAVQRKFRWDQNGRFVPEGYSDSLPILTIGGELDGLFRVFRIAEAYHHQFHMNPAVSHLHHPVLIVPGASHVSFASGKAPVFVQWNDLKPELEQNEGHRIIGDMMAQFLLAHAKSPASAEAEIALEQLQQKSALYFRPILDMLELEGSNHLKPACNELPPADPRRRTCWRGSPWSERAQVWMADLDKVAPNVRINVVDDFWKVWLINPVHLPAIEPSTFCQSTQNTSCTLQLTTVTQCTYSLIDPFDTGFTSVACDELRVKMKSRQSVHLAAGVANASFTELDDRNDICQSLNQHSIQLIEQAIANPRYAESGLKRIYERYLRIGYRLKVGEDLGPFNAGPTWIWQPLKFEKGQDGGGGNVAVVRSPSMRTPQDFWVPLSAGFHYCKLMSPARVLEWIYLDGIREAYRL